MKEIKKATRKYYLRVFFVLSLYFLFFAFLIMYFCNPYSIILCFFCYIPIRFIIRKIANKYIHSILYNEFDAEKYKEILLHSKFKPHVLFQLNAAIVAGDYQTVVNICTKMLKKKLSTRNKCVYLSSIARVYYELNDIEKLEVVCNKFNDIIKVDKNGKKLNQQIKIFRYYRYFIDGNYDACKAILEEISLSINDKWINAKILRIFNIYDFGVLSYKLNEFDIAINYFNQVIEMAPKSNCCKLAKKYLLSINSSCSINFNNTIIVPQEDFNIPYEVNVRRKFWFRTVLSFVCMLILVFTGFSSKLHSNTKQNVDNTIETNISSIYNEYSFFENVYIKYNNYTISSMCIVAEKNGNYDIWTMVTENDGKTIEFTNKIDDLKTGVSYMTHSTVGNFEIYFMMYKNKNSIPNTAYNIVELDNNNETIWLAIIDIVQIF